MNINIDQNTADAFATSWNNLPSGSVYTKDQFEDWMAPISKDDVAGKTVIELGCGNASLLVHMAAWNPKGLVGVDLGDSVISARDNIKNLGNQVSIVKADITTYRAEPVDLVYCIGVLHHLKEPYKGFESMIANTRKGGKFHGWVYAYEGNWVVRYVVDPIRRIVSHFPWWLTKYLFATVLVVPFYIYAKLLKILPKSNLLSKLPLYEYSLWIAKREFSFFRHVAFDQLVTPQTAYIKRSTIEEWLSHQSVLPGSQYIIMRNGNSWKFGGKIK